MHKPTDLRLTLETSDGRCGVQLLASEQTMTWSGDDGDGETVAATFESLFVDAEGNTTILSTVEIDGDDWRQLENERGAGFVWFWARRGVPLSDAVQSSLWNEDPRGYDSDYEESLDCLEDTIEHLRQLLSWAYGKLEHLAFQRTEDIQKLEEVRRVLHNR